MGAYNHVSCRIYYILQTITRQDQITFAKRDHIIPHTTRSPKRELSPRFPVDTPSINNNRNHDPFDEDNLRRTFNQNVSNLCWKPFHGLQYGLYQGINHVTPTQRNIKEEALYNPYSPITKVNWNMILRTSLAFSRASVLQRVRSNKAG
eukprot:226860_1